MGYQNSKPKSSFVSWLSQRIPALACQTAFRVAGEKAAWPPQPAHTLTHNVDLNAALKHPEGHSCCQSSKPAMPLSSAFLASSLNHQQNLKLAIVHSLISSTFPPHLNYSLVFLES